MAARLLAAAALARSTIAAADGQPAAQAGIFDELLHELAEVNAAVLMLAPATVTGLACAVTTLALLMWVYLQARAGGYGADEDTPAALRHADDFMQEWLEEKGREGEQHEEEEEEEETDEIGSAETSSARRQKVIAACIENYGVGSEDMYRVEWPNNVISRQAIVYGSGVIAKRGALLPHSVSPAELALCRRLAAECCKTLEGVEVGMGSESSDYFQPFYITAIEGHPAPEAIDADLVRARFGGTLLPGIGMSVEKLQAEGSGLWWQEVLRDVGGDVSGDTEAESEVPPGWRSMLRWFSENEEVSEAVFVRVTDEVSGPKPAGTQMVGSVLPRMAVGLTHAGSLVGVFGHVVNT